MDLSVGGGLYGHTGIYKVNKISSFSSIVCGGVSGPLCGPPGFIQDNCKIILHFYITNVNKVWKHIRFISCSVLQICLHPRV